MTPPEPAFKAIGDPNMPQQISKKPLSQKMPPQISEKAPAKLRERPKIALGVSRDAQKRPSEYPGTPWKTLRAAFGHPEELPGAAKWRLFENYKVFSRYN